MARTKRGNWKDNSGRKENFWLRLILKARAQDYSAKDLPVGCLKYGSCGIKRKPDRNK